MKSYLTYVVILFCSCLLATAAAQGAEPPLSSAPAPGGSLVVGTIGDASTMIPMLTADSASHEMSGFCYNGLVKYDKDLNLVGELAESWEVSPDNLTITFKLRRGVLFHDGKPYTSKDALFNWRFMVDEKTPTPYGGDYLKVAKAEAPDEYTFRVTYSEPFAPGLASWTLPQLPAHLLEGQDPRQSPLNRRPVGTGPYVFKEWEPGARVALAAFPGYWEGRAYLNELVYRVIPDTATLFLELQAGGVDWMGLSPLQYRRQTETPFFRKNFKKYQYLSSSYTYMGYNQRDERFRDKRVRQALSHAVDQQELIKGVLLGLGKPAFGPLKPGTYWENPGVRKFPYDPARAKALLAEAGWQDRDGDGLLDKDGQPFAFVLMTNQGNQARLNTAVIIQRRLAEIGIKVEIRAVEWAAFIREFVDKGRFEVVLLAWTIPQDPDLYDVWHSSNIGERKLNLVAFKNEELDRLLTAGRRTFAREERKAIYDRVQEILAEEQPYTFLYAPDALPMVHARIQGIEPAPAGIAYNLIRWWDAQAARRPALQQ